MILFSVTLFQNCLHGAVGGVEAQRYVDPCIPGSIPTMENWVPVLRMRPCKPRSRVAVGVAQNKTPAAKSHEG
jgi:hypothetical protein